MVTTIAKIYRAEVQIPQDLFERFGYTREYEIRSSQIYTSSNVTSSGQDSYSEVYEWAEDSSKDCVENFAAAWEMYISEMRRTLEEV